MAAIQSTVWQPQLLAVDSIAANPVFLTWILPTNWTIASPNIKKNNSLEKKLHHFKVWTSYKIVKNPPSCGKKNPHETLFLKTVF